MVSCLVRDQRGLTIANDTRIIRWDWSIDRMTEIRERHENHRMMRRLMMLITIHWGAWIIGSRWLDTNQIEKIQENAIQEGGVWKIGTNSVLGPGWWHIYKYHLRIGSSTFVTYDNPQPRFGNSRGGRDFPTTQSVFPWNTSFQYHPSSNLKPLNLKALFPCQISSKF